MIAAHLTDVANGQELANSMTLIAVACLVVFVNYLRHVLQRAEPSRSFLPATASAGGLLFAGMLLVGLSIQIASGVVDDYGADTQVAKTFYLIGWDFVYVFGPPLAVLIGATSAAGLLHGGVPRWLLGRTTSRRRPADTGDVLRLSALVAMAGCAQPRSYLQDDPAASGRTRLTNCLNVPRLLLDGCCQFGSARR